MPFKIDFFDGEVVEWSLTENGTTGNRVLDYTPTFYVDAGEGDGDALIDVQDALEMFPTVADTGRTVADRVPPRLRTGPPRRRNRYRRGDTDRAVGAGVGRPRRVPVFQR